MLLFVAGCSSVVSTEGAVSVQSSWKVLATSNGHGWISDSASAPERSRNSPGDRHVRDEDQLRL